MIAMCFKIACLFYVKLPVDNQNPICDAAFCRLPCHPAPQALHHRPMSSENPILNNPYAEPERHYAQNQDGELDYEDVRTGRRKFDGKVYAIPVQQKGQRDLLDADAMAEASHSEHLVSVLRRELRVWREGRTCQPGKLSRRLAGICFLGLPVGQSPSHSAMKSIHELLLFRTVRWRWR